MLILSDCNRRSNAGGVRIVRSGATDQSLLPSSSSCFIKPASHEGCGVVFAFEDQVSKGACESHVSTSFQSGVYSQQIPRSLRSSTVCSLLPAAVVVAVAASLISIAPTSAKPDRVRKASGIEKRELWTTSKVKGSPEPPDPYVMTRVYPKLKFDEALEIAAVPGQKAWGIAERKGKI